MSVPSDPNLTRQPSTLDTRTELPEDPPKAMGHDDDRADEVREAVETHKQAVQEASEGPEVGPRSPGDHAGGDEDADDDNDGDEEPADEEPEGTTFAEDAPEGTMVEESDDDVPEGTVAEVKEWVGDDPDRAQRALDAERAGPNRATLVTYLEGLI